MRRTILLPTSVGIALLLACAVAIILAAIASAPTATAASIDHGASFAVRCDFSHRAQVDPIRVPGAPSGHMHDFFGNINTGASSTYQSMTAGGAPTTCSRPEDTAGYWIPTVSWKDSTGTLTRLTANRGVFYYRAGLKNYRTVQPFAPDLRDINDQRITWFCGINDDGVGSATPPTRCSGGVLSLKIVFPDCVAKGDLSDPNLQPVPSTSNYRAGELIDPDTGQVIDPDTGQVIDSADHESHMVKSKLQNGARVCPSAYPIPVPTLTVIPVPTLTVNISFNMPTTSGTVVLSSDQPGDPPGASNHVDLWNTWNQDEPLNLNPSDGRSYGGLNALVKHCINEVPPDHVRPVECRAPSATGS
jgi:Domain of unknown function (DUF1996)